MKNIVIRCRLPQPNKMASSSPPCIRDRRSCRSLLVTIFGGRLWQLGDWTGDQRYSQLAKVMLVSCGQMTDLATGVQGEQLFQTNYQQHAAGDRVEGMRGGYSEQWNIYWITAHFLTAAAEFERMGINWREF